ncbi:unnamed protein product [Staurois parvus]|uniref:Mos1 transposase HTH domain-containing protein n=1 Tax=Staurois parvus TaxID=386267 RepID=A0ABN9BQS4_9NEOB|nr:unnamed protein product [Staurois parvus]
MSDRYLEQWIDIKFCMKFGKSMSEMLGQAYSEHFMKKSDVFEWHRWFKEGLEDVHDDTRSGQPKTQKIDRCIIGQSVNLSTHRLKIECVKDDRRTVHEQGNSEENSNGGFGNEKDFCEDGASSLDRRSERMSSSNFIPSFCNAL